MLVNTETRLISCTLYSFAIFAAISFVSTFLFVGNIRSSIGQLCWAVGLKVGQGLVGRGWGSLRTMLRNYMGHRCMISGARTLFPRRPICAVLEEPCGLAPERVWSGAVMRQLTPVDLMKCKGRGPHETLLGVQWCVSDGRQLPAVWTGLVTGVCLPSQVWEYDPCLSGRTICQEI